jgi:hypothetical protein
MTNVLHRPVVHRSAVRSAAAQVLHRLLLARHTSELVRHRLLLVEHSVALVQHRFVLAHGTSELQQRLRWSELVLHDEQLVLRTLSQVPRTEQAGARLGPHAELQVLRTWSQVPRTEQAGARLAVVLQPEQA